MSFRKKHDQSVTWKRWRDRHRDELAAAGVPDWIYSEKRRWLFFLQEDGRDWESGFDVEMLSGSQASRLLTCLERELAASELSSCGVVLRGRKMAIADRPTP